MINDNALASSFKARPTMYRGIRMHIIRDTVPAALLIVMTRQDVGGWGRWRACWDEAPCPDCEGTPMLRPHDVFHDSGRLYTARQFGLA